MCNDDMGLTSDVQVVLSVSLGYGGNQYQVLVKATETELRTTCQCQIQCGDVDSTSGLSEPRLE